MSSLYKSRCAALVVLASYQTCAAWVRTLHKISYNETDLLKILLAFKKIKLVRKRDLEKRTDAKKVKDSPVNDGPPSKSGKVAVKQASARLIEDEELMCKVLPISPPRPF